MFVLHAESFGNNNLSLGFVVLLLLSHICQLPVPLVLLIITKAGSNPVSTIGPLSEPLPVYEPNFEYPATDENSRLYSMH